jgi:hypothetical protein
VEKTHDALQPTLDALARAEHASVGLHLPLRDFPDYSIGRPDSDLEASRGWRCTHTTKGFGRTKFSGG